MRFFYTALLCLMMAAPAAYAQDDAEFKDYATYETFVQTQIINRNFAELIVGLGGGDEYFPAELAEKDIQLKKVWQRTFTNDTIFRREDFGGGISQEGRAFWTGRQYLFYHALLHQRDDKLVVLNFYINNSARKVMERF